MSLAKYSFKLESRYSQCQIIFVQKHNFRINSVLYVNTEKQYSLYCQTRLIHNHHQHNKTILM